MPATYAHYKFGKFVYQALPREIRRLLKGGRAAYLVGLHGPDLLFYYHPYGKNRINQLGVRMHREPASVFFEKARGEYQSHPSDALLAYLCGFLCHFALDSACHPYINEYMLRHGLGHLEIETDFDRFLMEEDGFNPTTHNCTRHLIRDLDMEEAVASVYDGVTADQIDDSIRGFRRCIRLFQCPGKAKAAFLTALSHLAGQKRQLGGLIMTGKPHPCCKESRTVLKEKLGASVDTAVRLIREYVDAVQTDQALSPELQRNFEE